MCILLAFLLRRLTGTACFLFVRLYSQMMDTFRWAANIVLWPMWVLSGWLFILQLKFHRNSEAVQDLIDEAIANRTEEGLVSGNHGIIESEIRFRDIQEQNGQMEKILREKEGRIAELEKSLQTSIKEKQTVGERAQQDSEDLKKQIQELKDTLEKTDAEKEETLTRLSRVFSLQIRDNNASIVDLSDANRPEKLAEQSNEIYDNQWVDAFDELEDEIDDEIIRIQLLLDILMICYTFSIWKGKSQIEFINKWFIPNPDDQSNLATQKQLKDARKQKAMECLQFVEKECIIELKQSVKFLCCLDIDALPNLQVYLSECIKLCWMMAVQDPPCVMLCPGWQGTISLAENHDHDTVAVDQAPESCGALSKTVRLSLSDGSQNSYPVTSNGDRVLLNKQLYKAFTQNGDYIQYMVWPCMLRHEDGHTLNKGVAQGCD